MLKTNSYPCTFIANVASILIAVDRLGQFCSNACLSCLTQFFALCSSCLTSVLALLRASQHICLIIEFMVIPPSSRALGGLLAHGATPASKSFRYKDRIFMSILLKIEFRKYFMFINQGPSFGHTALAMLYAYLNRRDGNLICYYVNYTPFFANPWVTEHEESKHVGWLTTSSITYIHLIDMIIDPKNLVIESVAFRAPVSVIDIPYVYYEPEQLSEILKRTIGKDMRGIEISRKTDVEIVVLGENITPTTIRLSLGDIIKRMEELIGISKRPPDKLYEIPIDLEP